MIGARAVLIGYGIAAIVGAALGAHAEYLAGLLTAWIGGAILSLLIAYAWCLAVDTKILGKTAPGDSGAPTRGTARLVKVWDRDFGAAPATVNRPRPARSVSA